MMVVSSSLWPKVNKCIFQNVPKTKINVFIKTDTLFGNGIGSQASNYTLVQNLNVSTIGWTAIKFDTDMHVSMITFSLKHCCAYNKYSLRGLLPLL